VRIVLSIAAPVISRKQITADLAGKLAA